MAALKLFRVGSFILVLTTFFFGSKKDQLTIEVAAAAGITMYFTKERHFYH